MDEPYVESTEGNGEPEDPGPLDSRENEGNGNNDGDVLNCGEIEVVSDNREREGPVSASLRRSCTASEADNDLLELAEADKQPWLDAIEKKDCRSLLEILNGKEDDVWRVSLCLKIRGEGGRTALHVAAMQGCFRLSKLLIDLVCKMFPCSKTRMCLEKEPDEHVYRAHYMYLSEVAYRFMDAEDGRSGLKAFEMANNIIGNTSISQYILYVRMKPEEKEKYGGMYKAYEGTEWHTALTEGDCEMLRKLLEYNSRFLLQTCDGLSVLDVAIMKDDKNLVEMVVSVFGPARSDKISWHAESYFPSELKWKWIAERHFGGWHKDLSERHGFHMGATQDKLAKLGLGRAERKGFLDSVNSALELAEKLGSSKEIRGLLGIVEELVEHDTRVYDKDRVKFLEALSTQGVFEPGVTEPLESKLPEADTLFDVAAAIDAKWCHEWTAGFLADVDYNFEEKSSLRFSMLRFHYAFKHALQCKYFIQGVIIYGFYFFYKCIICSICDGQGRTPFHTLVDHYNSNCTFEEIYVDYGDVLKSVDEKLAIHNIFGRDSRGRSSLTRAITKQFLEKDIEKDIVVSNSLSHFYGNILRLLGKLDNTDNILRKYQKFFYDTWLLRLSFFFEDENIFRLLVQRNEPSVLETVFDGVDLRSSNGETFQTRSLLWAAASGSQPILQLCLKNCDPVIEDDEGRTALHYAADANMFKFFQPPLSCYCSIEHRIKVEEHWMKKHRKEEPSNVNYVALQDSSTNRQSDSNVGRRACILMLIQAGVDLSQEDKKGNIPDPGTSSEASFQSWWYDIVVTDTGEKKNAFNQAGNALSVVGALVAATSYIGPLQPPLSYDSDTGYVEISRLLVKVFMVCNTLAFYLAVASVMFAVVPSLPMPQEGVVDELRRARHTVSWSLLLLVTSVGCILVSFAAASAVVIDNDHYYGASDILLTPSIIGWFFCLIAMASFLIRVMRLVFYKNSVIRQIYKNLSFTSLLKSAGSAIRRWTIKYGFSAWWWVSKIVVRLPIQLRAGSSFDRIMEDFRSEYQDDYGKMKSRFLD